MKLLLVMIGCTVTSALLAQQVEPDIQKLMKEKKWGMPNLNTNFKFERPVLGSTVPSRVHPLPLDNMPCVVPDTKDIAAIPNPAANYHFPLVGRMPGAGNKRLLIIPNGQSK